MNGVRFFHWPRLCVMAALWGLLVGAGICRGEDSLPTLRHVFVPVDQTNLWPKGDWLFVPFAEYQDLHRATVAQRDQRQDAFIEWQSLSATFDVQRGVLTDGRWTAEVRGRKSAPQLLSLEPFDAAVSELRWSDGDAIWGTTPDGTTQVFVDSDARKLEGRFTQQGRRLPRTWQFPVQVPNASVTELKLRVPTKFTLKSTVGHVRGPLSTNEEGWRLWQINLSGQSRCEVLLVDVPASPPTESIVVYEQSSSYVLREAEVELQYEVQAEVFHTPRTALTFVVPDDFTIYSVGFAAESRLNWHELPRAPGQGRQIEVQLPEPQIGKIRTIQLLAGAAAKWEPTWSIPRIQLLGGWFAGGRWNVSIDSPLIWRTMQTNGLRLASVTAGVAEARRLSFMQYLAEASLVLDIAHPASRLAVSGLQNLSLVNNEWQMQTEWHWRARAGSTFFVRCQVPADWEVLDVESASEMAGAGVKHWDVVAEKSGDRILEIEFVQPLSRGTPQNVRMTARRARSVANEREEFELPTPLDTQNLDQLLAISLPTGWQWDSDEPGLSIKAAANQTSALWTSFELWKRLASAWNDTTLLVPMKSLDPKWKPVAALRQLIEARKQESPAVVAVQPLQAATTDAPKALVEQTLVWSTAELRSLIFPGGDGHDRHWLTLKPPIPTRVGRLQFELPAPAELVSVRMNGVRTEPQLENGRYRLPSIPQGELESLVIQYQLASDHGFLRTRQAVPLPKVDAPVLGFRWLFAMTPESRLSEEPQGMRLLQPLDPTPWLRRLFGPLGRARSEEWFNPLSRSDWDRVWKPTPVQPDSEETSEEEFAPTGWRVREAIGPTLPGSVTWVAWNAHQVRVLAWVGMLFSVTFGCVLRVRRARPRVLIAALWLGLCGAGVLLSAPVAAEILGGCLIGTLIAVLIPRRVLMSYASRQSAQARGAFERTVSLPGGVVGLALLAGVLSIPLLAQEQNSKPIATLREDVLIPVDDLSQISGDSIQPSRKLPVALVTQSLWKRWQTLQSKQSLPTTLIESAQYRLEVEAQSTAIVADFVIHRSHIHQPVVVRWPFVSVPIAGANACLVDGKPHPISVSPDRDALLLELPATLANDKRLPTDARNVFMRHRVQLTLLPIRPFDSTAVRCHLAIPRVLNSRLVVPPGLANEWAVARCRGEVQTESGTGLKSHQLGMLDALTIEEPSTTGKRSRPESEARVDVACLAELLPTALRQRYRAHYSVVAGELDDVTWLLPKGVLVRDGDIVSDNLLHWTIEPLADGRQKLSIAFTKPQASEFTVEVAGLQPPIGTPDLSRWQPWQLDAVNLNEPAAAGTTRSRIQSFVLGVTSLSGFKLTLPLSNTEPLLSINEAAFAKAWGTSTVPRQPQLAFLLPVPTEQSFRIQSLLPQRKVRQELLLKLGRNFVDWEMHAEVSTFGTPAFQHDVLLPPDFQIDDVSVSEDEAERSVHWINTDQRLNVFLRDETTGIQNLFLHGRNAIPADGRINIPTHWFADTDASDFSVRIVHVPTWLVQAFDDQQQPLAPVETSDTTLERQELFFGKFRPEPNLKSMQLHLQPQSSSAKSEAWTTIAPTADGITVRHVEDFQSSGLQPIRIAWPNAWARTGTVKWSASLKELSRQAIASGVELTLQPLPNRDEPRFVIFEHTISGSSRQPFELRPPVPIDWANREHHWLLSKELLPWLSTKVESAPLDSQTTKISRLGPIEPLAPLDWLMLTPTGNHLEMLPPATEQKPSLAMTHWMESTAWVVNGTISHGHTTLLLQTNELRELQIRRPEEIRWVAVLVNEQPQEIRQAASVLLIDRLPTTPVVCVSLFWEIDSTQKDRVVVRRDTQLPMPVAAELQPTRHDLTLLTAGNSDISSTRGARRIPDWEGRLTRTASLLSVLKETSFSEATITQHLWEILQQEMELTKQSVAQTGMELGTHQAALEAVRRLSTDVELFYSNWGMTQPRTTLAPTHLWTHDHDARILNSWKATADLSKDAALSVILIDRQWMFWVVALFAVVALVPIVRAWLSWQTGEWLATHPLFANAVLGVAWWLWLTPSIVGILVLTGGIAMMLVSRPKQNHQSFGKL